MDPSIYGLVCLDRKEELQSTPLPLGLNFLLLNTNPKQLRPSGNIPATNHYMVAKQPNITHRDVDAGPWPSWSRQPKNTFGQKWISQCFAGELPSRLRWDLL